MKNQLDAASSSGPSAEDGNQPRIGGFLLALKDVFWPDATVTEHVPPDHAEVPARIWSGSPDDHPLRRVAGSAGRWKKQMAVAKAVWLRVTVDELVATDGHVTKLAGLIQERYGLTQEAAEQQVQRFFSAPGNGV